MQREDYVAANRAAWDESAPLHREAAAWRRLVEGFARPGFSSLDTVETALLEEVGVAGKSVAQLCCNNARELLSVKGMGAARCVGFDQSVAFLEQGRELARIAGHEIELVAGNVYDITPDYDGAFDVVLVTIGVFGWMPDLPAFFSVVARLLQPDGVLVVHEQHPIANMFEPGHPRPFEVILPYFTTKPFVETGAIVYDGGQGGPAATHYWFVHTLSDVVMGAIGAGLRLESFREYPDNISSAEFDIYETRDGVTMPLSYTLVARKA